LHRWALPGGETAVCGYHLLPAAMERKQMAAGSCKTAITMQKPERKKITPHMAFPKKKYHKSQWISRKEDTKR
ncbi:MAG: hypothetical protein IKZ98_16015, partial [Clostridia bacterium]|nr:hypothetical protein [Clostridia bacterium]